MSKRIVLLQALAASISSLMLLLEDVDPRIRNRRAADGESIDDVLGRLIAVEAHYLRRLQRVLVEERPFLPLILPDTASRNLPVTLDEFIAARQKTLSFLRDVAEDGWDRTAVHETQGEVTFHTLVQYLVDHDGEHLNRIVEIQQRLQAAPDRNAQPAISER